MRSRFTKQLLLFAGLLVVPEMALAASSLEYDCDTAAGAFSELKQSSTGRPVAVRGKVVARQFRADPRWLPAAAINVKAAGGNMVTLRIGAMERDKGPLSLQLLTTVNGKDDQQVLASAPIDQAIPFSIVPSADGFIVTLADERRQIAFAHGKSSDTTVTCSTGEFLFTDLRFGE